MARTRTALAGAREVASAAGRSSVGLASSSATKDSVVRGRVRMSDGGLDGLASLYVQLVSTSASPGRFFGDKVVEDGSFCVAVPGGTYVVSVSSASGAAPQYWTSRGLVADPLQAEVVDVPVEGVVDDFDAVFDRGAGISGAVISLGSQQSTRPIGHVVALVVGDDSTSPPARSQAVDLSAGRLSYAPYALDLPPATYRLALLDDVGDVVGWYGGASEADATRIELVPGRRVTNAHLRHGTDSGPPDRGQPRVLGEPRGGSRLALDHGRWPPRTRLSWKWPDGSDGPEYSVPPSGQRSVLPMVFAAVAADIPGWEPITYFTPYAGTRDDAGRTEPPTEPSDPSSPEEEPSDQPRLTTKPRLIGEARVGEVLSTDGGVWSGAPALAYQWLRDGSPLVPGGSASSYRVSPADVGSRLAVVVTARDSADTGRSDSSTPVQQGVIAPGAPRILGVPRVRRTLSLADTASSPQGAVTVQWLRNGSVIAGARGSSYRLKRNDRKKLISARVTWALTGYAQTSVTTATTTVR